MKSMKDRIKRLVGGKGVSRHASRRPPRGKTQSRSVLLTRAHSWGWLLKISILCAAIVIAALIALYLSDDVIKLLLSHHRGRTVSSAEYAEIIENYQILLSTVTAGLFSLVLSLGYWVIKNHDVEKGAQDTFSGQKEQSFSNGVRALLERASSVGNVSHAHGLRELARLAHQGAIEQDRINAVTGAGHDFRGANLNRIILADFDLQFSQLEGASLVQADLSRAQLLNADLSAADLRGAFMSACQLLDARLVETDLSGADLTRARLMEADLSRAKLVGADLQDADLTEAGLAGADLTGANFTEAKLVGADLGGADLRRVLLREADLSRANLTGTQLSGADLGGANLAGVQLSSANLSKANLTDTDLSAVDLSEADLQGAIYDENTKFPPEYDPAMHGLTRG